jgi:monoamine oxidase
MYRFDGGSLRVCRRVARELGRGSVVLESPVRQIAQGKQGVEVTSDKLNVRARRAIVAIPPTLAGRIDYRPGLPPAREQLTQRMPQGTMVKVAAVYERPFWREANLNGQALAIEGPVSATFDDSPEDGAPGVIFGFVGGDRAREFTSRSTADRRAAVLGQFGAMFGAAAQQPLEYFETNWAKERWTRGCPVAVLGPGTLTSFGKALRAPVGRIHWAGTETSTYWNGYMDGAVRSGERAAAEVLEAL